MNELLIILTSLFGGLNIFQFFFFRAEKRKAFAQADSMDLENARKAREIHKDDYEHLSKKCDKLTQDYFLMLEKAQKAMEEVSELKCEIAYLKGLRCYVTICPNRIQRKEYFNNTKNNVQQNG